MNVNTDTLAPAPSDRMRRGSILSVVYQPQNKDDNLVIT